MKAKRGPRIPLDISHALKRSRLAKQGFDHMPPSHQREYLAYIEEAKKPTTRARRTQQSLAMMVAWEKQHKRKRPSDH